MSERTKQRFRPGVPVVIGSDSPADHFSTHFSTVFDDDGETGYCYAYDRRAAEGQILDALHVYSVSAVADRQLDSVAEVVWSDDGLKSALLIDDYPHAVFDFATKCGYCRNDFPNFRPEVHGEWDTSTHRWDDAVMQLFCKVSGGGIDLERPTHRENI
jgi:hypothetical protein